MTAQTILTKQDAKKYSNLGDGFPSCQLTDIFQVEQKEFRVCLGTYLFYALRGYLVDYSDTQSWVFGSNYIVGDIVSNRGTYWVALGDNNTEPITENQYWGLAPKFDDGTECGQLYNFLWCNYLARYLSLKVAILTAPRMTVKLTGEGAVRSTGNGIIPADANEIEKFLYRSFDVDSVQVFENMMAWINEQENDDCFGKFDCGVPVNNCKPCSENKAGCNYAPKSIGYSVY